MTEGEKKKPVIILGAGGHAKVVADTAKCSGREIIGFVTPYLPVNSEFFGLPVLGDDESVFNYKSVEIELINGVGSLPNQRLRRKLCEKFRRHGYFFGTLVHPNASLSADVRLTDGVQIMAGVIMQPGVSIGRDSIINTRVSIDHDCHIGESCHIAPGVTLSGDVVVGAFTHIGTGASVIQSINIGKNSFIGAGSIIFKNVLDNSRVIQQRQEFITKNDEYRDD